MTEPNLNSSGRRFELVERIGAGAYGEVYLAQQHSDESGFHRRVALKLLHADRTDEDTKHRIRDEARILGHIQHRSVVTAFDLVRIDDRWGVVMDYVPGCDLQELINAQAVAQQTVPMAAALQISSEVAYALHAAWTATGPDGKQLHVVHRDVKPSNIRLTPDGDVKVLDFGIATARMASREAETGSQVMGTLAYMSPERLNGNNGNPPGDVYALTMVALELLLSRSVGRPPAAAEPHAAWVASNILALQQRLSSSLATASLLVPLLERGLSYNPSDRPTASELADQLDYLSRSVPGVTLRDFAARFVPQVDQLLQTERVPATGIIDAATGRWSDSAASSGLIRNTPLPPALITAIPKPPPIPSVVSIPTLDERISGPVFVEPPKPKVGLWVAGGTGLIAILALLLWFFASPSPTAASDALPPVNETMIVAEAPRDVEPVIESVVEPLTEPVQAPTKAARAPTRRDPPRITTPPPTVIAVANVVEPEVIEAPPKTPEPQIADVAPPVPEPVVAPPVSVAGNWVGNAGGRPITLRLKDASPGVVTGRIELILGPSVRSFTVAGIITSDGTLDLADAKSDLRFKGTATGGTLNGTYQTKSNGKWLTYSTSRN